MSPRRAALICLGAWAALLVSAFWLARPGLDGLWRAAALKRLNENTLTAPAAAFQGVEVEANGLHLTLRGSVADPGLRLEAENRMRGLFALDLAATTNQITVPARLEVRVKPGASGRTSRLEFVDSRVANPAIRQALQALVQRYRPDLMRRTRWQELAVASWVEPAAIADPVAGPIADFVSAPPEPGSFAWPLWQALQEPAVLLFRVDAEGLHAGGILPSEAWQSAINQAFANFSRPAELPPDPAGSRQNAANSFAEPLAGPPRWQTVDAGLRIGPQATLQAFAQPTPQKVAEFCAKLLADPRVTTLAWRGGQGGVFVLDGQDLASASQLPDWQQQASALNGLPPPRALRLVDPQAAAPN